MHWWLVAALAAAQGVDEPADRPLDAVDYEVVVTAEQDVLEAREALQQAVRDLGYGRGLKLGKRRHHAHRHPWKGRVMVHEEGFVRVRVPWALPMPGMRRDPVPQAARSDSQLDGGWGLGDDIVGGTLLIGGRRWRQAQKATVVDALEPRLREVRDAIARREQAWRLLELHGSLDRVWEAGLAPDGAPLPDHAARRAWLAERWLGTADNADGAAVRARIAAFVQNRVQESEHPFTEAELSHLHDHAPFPEPLVSDR